MNIKPLITDFTGEYWGLFQIGDTDSYGTFHVVISKEEVNVKYAGSEGKQVALDRAEAWAFLKAKRSGKSVLFGIPGIGNTAIEFFLGGDGKVNRAKYYLPDMGKAVPLLENKYKATFDKAVSALKKKGCTVFGFE